MNPAIRKDHLNPMFGLSSKRLIKIGQTTPPIDDPEYNIPIAIALLLLNQWLIHATDGKKLLSTTRQKRGTHIREMDIPKATP